MKRQDEGEEGEPDAKVRVFEAEDGSIQVTLRERNFRAETVISQYGKQVLRYIMEHPRIPYQRLGQLEGLNKETRQWAQRRELWAHLCFRDYPEAYSRAKSAANGQVSDEMKAKLDTISDQPGRLETYWKRFYELIIYTKERGKYAEELDTPWLYHYFYRRYKSYSYSDFVTQLIQESGEYAGHELELYAPNTAEADEGVLCYLVPNIKFDAVQQLSEEEFLRVRDGFKMLRVRTHLDDSISFEIVDCDVNLPGRNIYYRRGKGRAAFLRPTGYELVIYDSERQTIALVNAFVHIRPRLVSQCIQCVDLASTRICSGCESVAYCSEACAEAHWQSGGHWQECAGSRK